MEHFCKYNNIVKHYELNESGRDFVIGDIHGMYAAVETLLKKADFNPNIDRLFSVGDLIDRGDESERVLEFLEKPWFSPIMGNHERMLLDSQYCEKTYRNWTKHYEGKWWNKASDELKKKIISAFSKFPLIIDVETQRGLVGIVHADVPSRSTWKMLVNEIKSNKRLQKHVLWSRARYERYLAIGATETIKGVSKIICGHNTLSESMEIGNICYIDTGAAYINDKKLSKLTMVQIQPQIRYVQTMTRKKAWF